MKRAHELAHRPAGEDGPFNPTDAGEVCGARGSCAAHLGKLGTLDLFLTHRMAFEPQRIGEIGSAIAH